MNITQSNHIVLFDASLAPTAPIALWAITAFFPRNTTTSIITPSTNPDYIANLERDCGHAHCLGISVIAGENLGLALAVSRHIKRLYPGLPIIWGGWGASTLAQEIMAEDCCDYVCRGQGERVFTEFVDMLDGYIDVRTIRGLSYKQDGFVIHNSLRVMEDPNEFPEPDYARLDWERCYQSSSSGRYTLPVFSSIGCTGDCGFCCEAIPNGRHWYGLSALRTIARILNMKQLAPKMDAVQFMDSNFFASEGRVLELATFMIRSGLKLKITDACGRADELKRYDSATWKRLKKAGLDSILIGFESANDATLRLINKRTTVRDSTQLIRICAEHDMRITLSAALGWNAEEYRINQDVAFLRELTEFSDYMKRLPVKRHVRLMLFKYLPYPGTPLMAKAEANGFTRPSTIDAWAQNLSEYTPPWMQKISPELLARYELFRWSLSIMSDLYPRFLLQLNSAILCWSGMALYLFIKMVQEVRLRLGLWRCPVDRYIFSTIENMIRQRNKKQKWLNLLSNGKGVI